MVAKNPRFSPVPRTPSALLRMAKRDYMCQAQLEFFQRKLLQDKEIVEARVASVREAITEEQREADELDRASNEEETRQQLLIVDRELKLIRKIGQALQRIHQGTYGYCLETGDPIGLERLLLRPTAELCAEAKKRQEQREKHFAKRRG